MGEGSRPLAARFGNATILLRVEREALRIPPGVSRAGFPQGIFLAERALDGKNSIHDDQNRRRGADQEEQAAVGWTQSRGEEEQDQSNRTQADESGIGGLFR